MIDYNTRPIVDRINDRMKERTRELYTVSDCGQYLEYRDGMTYERVKRPENGVMG